ncbi:MAG: Rieske 2Fe-2S domain-containing protein [Thermoplasmata archaeon]
MGELVKLCDVDQLEEGRMLYVEILGCDYIVVQRAGEVYALDGTCTYDWTRLDEGVLENDVVTCPTGGGQYNIKTGEVVKTPPSFPLQTYPVTVDGAEVLADVTGY